jgi:hypothetical protein
MNVVTTPIPIPLLAFICLFPVPVVHAGITASLESQPATAAVLAAV